MSGSLVSSQYERQAGSGKKPATLKLTSWQIRANTLRKLNCVRNEPEPTASSSPEVAQDAPLLGPLSYGSRLPDEAHFSFGLALIGPAANLRQAGQSLPSSPPFDVIPYPADMAEDRRSIGRDMRFVLPCVKFHVR